MSWKTTYELSTLEKEMKNGGNFQALCLTLSGGHVKPFLYSKVASADIQSCLAFDV